MSALTLLVGVAIAVGLVGVVVPVLPGALLVAGAVLVWAVAEGTFAGWAAFAVGVVAIGVAQVVKYVVPTRRLRTQGVPTSTLLAGAVLGSVGFFVIPVVGLFLGFPVGVYAAEWQRLRSASAAWDSTRKALAAVGLSLVVELAGSLVAAAAWLTAVVLT